MGNGNRPTPEFRREAVRLALTGGRTRREIAEDLGIGLSTLTRWLRDPDGQAVFSQDRDEPHEIVGGIGDRHAPPARLAAHQPQADEFEPHALDHRLDDVRKATVDRGFGDQVGHAVQTKSGP